MTKIRILALDGAGSRAGVHARALGRLYGDDTPGREIVRQFDFIAGNSGGSIVLTALCCNYTPLEIAGFYDDPDTVRRMFSPRWVAYVPLLRYVLPRYSAEGKFAALREIFDRRRKVGEPLPSTINLRDWPSYLKSDVNLLVIALDYDRERASFFRSNVNSVTKSSAPPIDATLVEAVHASTNAPVIYYDKPAEVSGGRYWDGALAGYNNPVLAAVVEALANRPGHAADMRVLSLGTGTTVQPLTTEGAPPPMGKAPDNNCLFTWIRKAATVIVGDPPDAATFHAHVALGQRMPRGGAPVSNGNVVRLCPFVSPIWDLDPVTKKNAWRLPFGLSEADFLNLLKLEVDSMDRSALDLIRKMCDLWIADKIPNQPIRAGDHLRCDIGQDRFSEAAKHWHYIAS
ncbi:MAG TPA: patatin-like phospholipase family protein [Casimicrobiaceae bacterium]|nr:patatin-like phospholipase family protein [Casimicrobiaceae bacterium]